jgi:hypothetical protein
MSKIRELVEKLPKIAKVKDHERFSKRNLIVFDLEATTNDTEFKYKKSDNENPRKRLLAAEIPKHIIGDAGAYEFGMDLIALCALCHRANKNELINKEITQKDDLEKSLRGRSRQTSEIKKIEDIVSIDEALRGWWYS